MSFASNIEREIWWLGKRPVAGMPRPRIAPPRRHDPSPKIDEWDDDLPVLWENEFRSIVCLTDPRDEAAITKAGFRYLALTTPDGQPPQDGQVDQFLHFYHTAPKSVAVHCEGGIGRTGTMLAVVLMSEGKSAEAAIKAVRDINRSAVETPAQEKFLRELKL